MARRRKRKQRGRKRKFTQTHPAPALPKINLEEILALGDSIVRRAPLVDASSPRLVLVSRDEERQEDPTLEKLRNLALEGRLIEAVENGEVEGVSLLGSGEDLDAWTYEGPEGVMSGAEAKRRGLI